jgi:hypothetical protein
LFSHNKQWKLESRNKKVNKKKSFLMNFLFFLPVCAFFEIYNMKLLCFIRYLWTHIIINDCKFHRNKGRATFKSKLNTAWNFIFWRTNYIFWVVLPWYLYFLIGKLKRDIIFNIINISFDHLPTFHRICKVICVQLNTDEVKINQIE